MTQYLVDSSEVKLEDDPSECVGECNSFKRDSWNALLIPPYLQETVAREITTGRGDILQVSADETAASRIEGPCDCFLCRSMPEARPSHCVTALKVLLATPSFLVGIWPQKYKLFRYFFIFLGIVINTYISLGNIFAWQVCGKISNVTTEALSPWLCYGNTIYNETKHKWAGLLDPVVFVRYLFCFSQFSGYLMMLYSLRMLTKTRHALDLKSAASYLSRRQWMSVNVQIFLYFGIWLTFQLFDSIFSPGQYMPTDRHVNWLVLENAIMWLYIGTPCWIFAAISLALESLANVTFHKIRDLRTGTLNDVINIHKLLCNHVFGTVCALKYWFVVHWVSFGMSFVMDTAIGFKVVDKFKDKTEFAFWVYSIVFLLVALHPFLYPCIRAASLTNQCERILERLNYLSDSDWPRGNPLRDRSTMNGFLAYANQVQCGFCIGRLRFNNGLAWLSIFFGLCGFGLKLL